MILVVGATGFLGREICRRLIDKGREVRGLTRPTSDPSAVDYLINLGVQRAQGDLKDRASLDAACQGVDTVISTATAMRSRQDGDAIESVDTRGQINLVDAARDAGVARFVYVSYSGQIGIDDPLTKAKRGVEQRLKQSGMVYTILRPSYFMEAWLSPSLGFDFPNAKATIYGSGKNKISWISMRDVAEFAVRSLDNPAAKNAVLELGGPEALSPDEAVSIFEKVAGRRFDIQHVPEEALKAQKAAAPDSLQRSFAALMLAYASGDAIETRQTLQTFPIHLTSVQDYARQVLST